MARQDGGQAGRLFFEILQKGSAFANASAVAKVAMAGQVGAARRLKAKRGRPKSRSIKVNQGQSRQRTLF